jgi:hypothetical protein
MNRFLLILLVFVMVAGALTGIVADAKADGVVVDKVYHPYVLPLEREVEFRLLSHKNDDGNNLAQRIAYGHSLSETMTLEAYLVGDRDEDGNFKLDAYEFELRWMMTEQGQYWADWGMLYEFEKEHTKDSWEITTGLLFEKELGRTSVSLNAFLIYEWGGDVINEFETEFRAQYRYRWMPQVQPAIEFYAGEDYIGIGPALMGIQRFSGQKQLKWEVGFITGLNGDSKDHILRVAVEFEF